MLHRALGKEALNALIRLGLFAALLFGVYGETGWFTTSFLAFVAAFVEIHSFQHRIERIRGALFGPLRDLSAILGKITQK